MPTHTHRQTHAHSHTHTHRKTTVTIDQLNYVWVNNQYIVIIIIKPDQSLLTWQIYTPQSYVLVCLGDYNRREQSITSNISIIDNTVCLPVCDLFSNLCILKVC